MAETELPRCPVCGRPIRAARLESHIRKAHPAPPVARRRRVAPVGRPSPRAIFLAVAVILLLVCAGTAYHILTGEAPQEPSPSPPAQPDRRTVATALLTMVTDAGDMLIALYGNATPVTVRHFLALVAYDYYNGTIFHVAVKDQLVMGGGYLSNLSQKLIPLDPETGKIPSIPLEINPVMKNTVGTLGMVHNDTDPDTAVTEFYINLADNPSLDKSSTSPGFSVFGEIVGGLDVARDIGNLTTSDQVTPGGMTLSNVPVRHIQIQTVVVLTQWNG